jgi:hypothetical protein
MRVLPAATPTWLHTDQLRKRGFHTRNRPARSTRDCTTARLPFVTTTTRQPHYGWPNQDQRCLGCKGACNAERLISVLQCQSSRGSHLEVAALVQLQPLHVLPDALPHQHRVRRQALPQGGQRLLQGGAPLLQHLRRQPVSSKSTSNHRLAYAQQSRLRCSVCPAARSHCVGCCPAAAVPPMAPAVPHWAQLAVPERADAASAGLLMLAHDAITCMLHQQYGDPIMLTLSAA